MALVASAGNPANKPPVEQTVVLELAIYQRYTRQGTLYTKLNDKGRDQHYGFTTRQAAILLQEIDDVDGRPVWRRPRVKKTAVQEQVDFSTPVVFDASADRVNVIELDETVRIGLPGITRLEDGTDEEFAELLGQSLGDLDSGETQQV